MRKILIIKLGALGDVVMATGLIKAIQQHHQADQLYLLTSPAYMGLFEHWRGLHVVAFPRKGPKAFLRMVSWVRRNRFARLYDLQSNNRTTLLCALSGVAERIGNHPRYPYTHHPRDKYIGQSHVAERLVDVVKEAGVDVPSMLPLLPTSEKNKDNVEKWLDEKHLGDGKYILMHPGSSPRWPNKRWPYYRELAQRLDGYQTVWIGTEPDTDINRSLASETGIDATNQFGILELVELGRRARFAITNDSGPMHILSSSGLPIYSFFGPTNWRRSHAIGQRDRVLVNASVCNACGQTNRRTADNHTCLSEISVDSVYARLAKDERI